MRALTPHTPRPLKPAQPPQVAGWPLPGPGLSLCPSLPPYLPGRGFHVCPLVPGSTGSWDVPARAIFTQPCPHGAVLWLHITAWGAEPLPGLGVDSQSLGASRTPSPRQHLILTLNKGYN